MIMTARCLIRSVGSVDQRRDVGLAWCFAVSKFLEEMGWAFVVTTWESGAGGWLAYSLHWLNGID